MPRPTRWMRSPISPIAIRSGRSGSATSRTWCSPMWRNAIFSSCGVRSMPSPSRPRMSVASPTSSRAPGSIAAVLPMPALFRWPRSSPGGSALSIPPATLAGCTSPFLAASMPAATITSAISASWASRKTARSSTRSPLAAAPTNGPSLARCSDRPSLTGKSPTWWKRSWPHTSNCGLGRTRPLWRPSSVSASSPSRSGSMPLIKTGRVIADRYVNVLDDSPLPESVPVLVPAARFLADAAEILQRDTPVGVIWPNSRKVAELAPYLERLAAVALVFPNFKDGRAYSQARLFREPHGYHGQLRATGHILLDQFPFLVPAGFHVLDVAQASDPGAFAVAIKRYTAFYPASPERQ